MSLELDQIIDGTTRPPWRRRPVLVTVGAAVVVAIAVWAFLLRGGGAAPASAQPETKATVGSLSTTLSVSGTASAVQSSTLTFAGSGVVTDVLVQVGDQVTAGHALARLDGRDAQRALAGAELSLEGAQTRLQQLLEPPTTADTASAEQSVLSARTQLDNAQTAYDELFHPTAATIESADTALNQAKNTAATAANQVASAKLSLVAAQDSYCFAPELPLGICAASDLPLTQHSIDTLTSDIQLHVLTSTVVSRVTALLQANTSYLNALTSRDAADAALVSVQATRDSLDQPPLPADVQQAQAALVSAQAGLDAALAKQQALLAGAAATDVALQRQSVTSAQLALQAAQDGVADLTLTAPYDGTIGAVTYVVGQRSGSGSIVVSNPNAVRLDLTVSETDLEGLKAGVLGVARFDALPGNTYVVQVTGVSPVPTVTQGVVTYPVQAQILRGDALTAVRDQLPSLLRAAAGGGGAQFAATFGGGVGGASGAFAGRAGASGAGGTAGERAGGFAGRAGAGAATATPGAGAATGTPGAGGPAGARAGANGAALAALLNPPLPAAGMNASVTLLLSVTDNQLLVPSGAIRRQGSQTFVYLPAATPGGTPQQRAVVVGGSDGTNTAIVSGLNEGDTVLLGAIATAGTPAAVPTRTTEAGGGGGVGRGAFGGPGGGAIR